MLALGLASAAAIELTLPSPSESLEATLADSPNAGSARDTLTSALAAVDHVARTEREPANFRPAEISSATQPRPPQSVAEEVQALPPDQAVQRALDLLPGTRLDTLEDRQALVILLRQNEALAPERIHSLLLQELSPERLSQISDDPDWATGYVDVITHALVETSPVPKVAVQELSGILKSYPEGPVRQSIFSAYVDVYPQYKEAMLATFSH